MHIEKKQDLINDFVKLTQRADCVIGCRLTPQQKRQLVQIFKNSQSKAVTLSVGDGPNDASMMRVASVSVAISPKFPSRIAFNADYSITEFRALPGLLLNTGRETYRKNCHLVLHGIYKAFLLTVPNIMT